MNSIKSMREMNSDLDRSLATLAAIESEITELNNQKLLRKEYLDLITPLAKESFDLSQKIQQLSHDITCRGSALAKDCQNRYETALDAKKHLL